MNPWEVIRAQFCEKCDGDKLCVKLKFRSVFHASSWNFKILDIPNVLAHGMSYEHGFVKNGIVINLAQSLVSFGF
ncbi:hypothetical protein BHM03_00041682 [Ensete ventricosum]|nr:hypothetical protein BHM03_00041682 [Ensete ventricosum]